MPTILWEKEFTAGGMILSGGAASGLTLAQTTGGIYVSQLPLQTTGPADKSLIIPVGRLPTGTTGFEPGLPIKVEALASSAQAAQDYQCRIKCSARSSPESGDTETYNPTATDFSLATLPTANNLQLIAVEIATGAAQDNAVAGDFLTVLFTLLGAARVSAYWLLLRSVKFWQEIPD